MRLAANFVYATWRTCLHNDYERRSRIEFFAGHARYSHSPIIASGPPHGHAIAKHIKQTSEEVFHFETGSLYPALRRLDAKRWISASREQSDKGKRVRFYRLTVEIHFDLEEGAEERPRGRIAAVGGGSCGPAATLVVAAILAGYLPHEMRLASIRRQHAARMIKPAGCYPRRV